ncbi:uncharacterized protein PODANS_3_3960 [Podospora anserina S mat+]|uniref:RING-type E3 ubiquitin transferase n=1 Tax=Podospora anserina (strain S / ATCC MYA-4624 / DSM 980 / FGSC 10383) TaxID=515849 RepID=B2AZ33_PODAN|nr:uncharacterized protein PODANS_3_3960 [Podospora anserina S mat+]CAP70313.1 unnamed protein product [Podospora anserina S mat+]CDP26906.1 Putative protein of unknown function [Podospora anserina S mat+]
MASFGMGPPRRHLDANAGREVVYCHSCAHEWYSDEQPPRLEPECPRCHSEIVEIVEPGESDPRIEAGGLGLGGGGSGSYFRRNAAGEDSDPEEDDIENHLPGGPARSPFGRGLFPPSPGAPDGDNNRPGDEVFNRFFELIMHDLGGGRHVRESQGANNNPGAGAAPSPPQPGRHVHSATFTFVSGPGVRPDQPPPILPLFGPYARSHPRHPYHRHHHSGPHRTVTFVTGGNFADGDPLNRMLAHVMGVPDVGGPQEQGQPGNRAAGPPPMGGGVFGLQQLLSTIMNPAAAVHGDAVFTQEALDRIITQLMENSPQTNAAPPASETAIASLERKKVDAELLGPEGKAECTICIDEFKMGDEVTVLPCSHWYHGECVVLWLKEHNTCPICRKPIENREENNAGDNSSSGQRSPGADQAASSSSHAQQPRQSSNEGARVFATFSPRVTAPRPVEEGVSGSSTGYQIPTLFSSYTSRVRTPQENQERLERMAGGGGGQRRSSASPPGAWPEDDTAEPRSSRQRSPSRPRDENWGGNNSGSGTPGESNRRSYFSSFTSAGRDQQQQQQQQQREGSSSSNNNNNGGNGGSSSSSSGGGGGGIASWIRDHWTRDRGNGNGNGNGNGGRR